MSKLDNFKVESLKLWEPSPWVRQPPTFVPCIKFNVRGSWRTKTFETKRFEANIQIEISDNSLYDWEFIEGGLHDRWLDDPTGDLIKLIVSKVIQSDIYLLHRMIAI